VWVFHGPLSPFEAVKILRFSSLRAVSGIKVNVDCTLYDEILLGENDKYLIEGPS